MLMVSDRPPFTSILFERPPDHVVSVAEEPSYFTDLRLDQVLESVLAGRSEYDLRPFFYAPLHDSATVRYRQEVLQDLEDHEVRQCMKSFAEQMHWVRAHLTGMNKLHDRLYEEGWFLDSAEMYCAAVNSLSEGLNCLPVSSRGFTVLRDYLAAYRQSQGFVSLETEAARLRHELGALRYCMHIRGTRVTVVKYAGEPDYSLEVEEIFARFKQGAVKDYRVRLTNYSSMDHVQGHILQLVARLFPDVFASLHRYRADHGSFVDLYVRTFDREVQFYLAYLEHIDWLRDAGLPFCYPEVSAESKEVFAEEAFDLALANTLVPQGLPIVCNDFTLADPERIFVVTGANQGGKTTFARMFGQLLYFAALGFPVPARRARLCLPDRIFTHFEKEEDLTTLRGKLEDELVRVHEILHEATSRSVVIMNESFTATTLADALYIGTAVLEQVIDIGSLCVYVTFVDELSSLSDTTVSMVATVVPQDPDVRTYKVERKPADGRAHAVALAHKYGLSYESLIERVTR